MHIISRLCASQGSKEAEVDLDNQSNIRGLRQGWQRRYPAMGFQTFAVERSVDLACLAYVAINLQPEDMLAVVMRHDRQLKKLYADIPQLLKSRQGSHP